MACGVVCRRCEYGFGPACSCSLLRGPRGCACGGGWGSRRRGLASPRPTRAVGNGRRACALGVVVRSPPGALRSAESPRPAPLMAKRRAEPLVCYAPFKRLLREPPPPPRSNVPERRPRNEAAGAGPAAKRKLEEAEAPPGKRPGLRGGSPRGEQSDAAGRRRRRGEPAAPQDERTAEGSDGRRGEEPAAAPVTVRGAGRGGAGGAA